MHGLKTINQLNNLAAQNAPGAAEAAMAAADASRAGQPSASEIHFQEATTRARQSRLDAIEKLSKLSLKELLDQVDALQLPSTLEAAVSIKLHTILERGHLQEPDLGAAATRVWLDRIRPQHRL